MEAEKKKEQLLSPRLCWFMFAMVLANISIEVSFLLYTLHLANLGADITQIGLVYTIIALVSLVLQIFGGWVSDSIGRLKAIAIGSIGAVISVFAIALAPTRQWFVVAMILAQLPSTLIGPSVYAFIAENSTEENRGKVYGISDMLYAVCGIIGPALGGLLSDKYGFSLVFWLSAILCTAAAAVRLWMVRTMKSAKVEKKQELTWGSFKRNIRALVTMILGGGIITWLFLTDGVFDTANSLVRNIESLYLKQIIGLDVAQIGLLGSVFSVALLVTPLLSGKLSDKYGERVPICTGFLMFFVAYTIFLVSDSFVPFIIVRAIFGLGVGICSPAYSSLISKVVPHDKLGVFNGVFHGAIGLIALPAPYLGTLMWEHIDPKAPFFIVAIVSLLIIVPIWLTFKLPKEEERPSTADELGFSN